MTIKGELKDIKLPDIFQMVAMQQQEGTLIVSDGETKKWLYFSRDGVILLSSGKRRPTPLGQMLLRAGRITEKQLDDALAVWRRTGKRLGEVLCDFGLTTQEEIGSVVQEQIAEEIYDLLDWQGTTFEFIPGPPPEEFAHARGDRRDLQFDVNTILLEAARRADEWDKIEEEIGSINEIFVRNKLKGASADLEGDALSVYPMIDGVRTVHDIVTTLRLPKADVGRALLALMEIGLIRTATREEILRLANQPGIEERGDRLAHLLELAVAREENIELRKRLAGVYEDLGRPAEAATHHRHLAGVYTEQYKLAEAAEELREAARLLPEDTDTREQLVELYVRLTNIPHAVLHLKRLAKQHLDRKAMAKALACYRRALQLCPNDFECRKQVVDMLIEIKDVDTALDECIKLEESAVTQIDRQDVRDRYATLLALAPNLFEAKKRLAGLTEVERRMVRSRRFSRRAVVLLFLLFAAASVAVFLYWTKQKEVQEKQTRFDQLIKEKRYDQAEDLVSGDDSEQALALREAVQKRRQQEEEREKKRVQEMEMEARSHERAGRLDVAAKLYIRLSEELARSSTSWRAEDMKEKARRLEELWQYGMDEKRIGEDMVKAEQYKEAHEQFARMVERSPDLAKALGVTLPIYVTSIPSGASLSVDGFPSGETPKAVRKQPGSPLRIAVEKAGHQTRRETVIDESVWRLALTLPRIRRWLFESGGAVEAGPRYHDDALFVGSRDGVLYVLDAKLGAEKWRFAASDDIMTTPAVADGCVFFGTSDGAIYAVDLQTHQAKWKKMVRGFIRSSPAVAQEGSRWIVLIGASDARLYAFDAGTGKQIWSYQASQAIETSPHIADGQVFIADDGGNLYALHTSNGEPLWQFKADGPVYTSPQVEQGMVFIGSEKGTVYAVDAAKGGKVWEHPGGSRIHVTMAVDKARLYVGCDNGVLLALDINTGELKWKFTAEAGITSPPVFAKDILYVGCANGTFYALAATDGTVNWQAAADKAVRAPTALSENTIYVGADDSRVYAFEQ